MNKPHPSAPARRKRVVRGSALPLWLTARAPVFLFCAKFCGLLILFYFLWYLPVCRRALDASTLYYARIGSVLLNHLGQATHCDGATIWSAKSGLTVLPECAGFEFPLFFIAMVLSFPSRFAAKAIGILCAAAFFPLLNLVRVTSLFLVEVHFPSLFDAVHERIWSTLLVSALVILAFLWIQWAARPQSDDATV